MAKTPDTRQEIPRFNKKFRSWLSRKMISLKMEKVNEQISRFEAVAQYLHPDQLRPLDFTAIAKKTGIKRHLLRDVTVRMCKKVKIVECEEDEEGSWWSITMNPYDSPFADEEPQLEEANQHAESDQNQEREMPSVVTSEHTGQESPIEKNYRRCCDSIRRDLGTVLEKLDNVIGHADQQTQAFLWDIYADLTTHQAMLVRVCGAGVRQDKEAYLESLVSEFANQRRDR